MKRVIHRANDRGRTKTNWLESCHSFSFGSHYDPKRSGFGTLVVMNDDTVQPNAGFPLHEHQNMEIVSIITHGQLLHQDGVGNEAILGVGDIQHMSAGRSIFHSEMNASKSEPLKFLQIWILPREENGQPAYQTKHFNPMDWKNKIKTVVSAVKSPDTLLINQEAFISLLWNDPAVPAVYVPHRSENGAFLFVIAGNVSIGGDHLYSGDVMEITEPDPIHMLPEQESSLLFIEVPMS